MCAVRYGTTVSTTVVCDIHSSGPSCAPHHIELVENKIFFCPISNVAWNHCVFVEEKCPECNGVDTYSSGNWKQAWGY